MNARTLYRAGAVALAYGTRSSLQTTRMLGHEELMDPHTAPQRFITILGFAVKYRQGASPNPVMLSSVPARSQTPGSTRSAAPSSSFRPES
jgi:hypothetical protein